MKSAKDFIKELEKSAKKNLDEKMKSKKLKEDMQKRKKEQEERRISREKKLKQKEEEKNRFEKERKKQSEEEDKKEKQKQKEQKNLKLQQDLQKREKALAMFRMNNNIIESSDKNFNEKKSYWNDLAIKEENLKKLIEKEKEMRKLKKQKILENQYKSRNETKNINSQSKNELNQKQKQTIEDMCIYGDIIKKEIIEEKKINPEKFISIEEATKNNSKTNPLFVLGLLAKNLEQSGITTVIEKSEIKKEDNKKENKEENKEEKKKLRNHLHFCNF